MTHRSRSETSPAIPKPSLRDRVAVWLSIACAVHCLVTPLLLFVVPALGVRLTVNPWVEFSILAFVLVLGGSSVRHAYQHHGSRAAPALFVIAFIGLCAAPFLPDWDGTWVVHLVLAAMLSVSLLWPHMGSIRGTQS